MKNVLIFISLFIVIFIVLLFLAINYIAPYAVIQPHKRNGPIPLNIDTTSTLEHINIQTTDSLTLKGYWMHQQGDSCKGLMILLHGIGGCKEHFLPLANALAQQGIASILMDGRAHGESEGRFCTYGAKEKHDISTIIDYAHQQNPALKIGIWGNSLGGAIALQTMAIDQRIRFGVIESTFAELDQIVFDYKKRYLKGFGIKAISDHVLKKAGQIAEFEPDSVKPVVAAQAIDQAVLIAHGQLDKSVSYTYGKRNFEALASEDKEWVLIDNADHYNLFEQGGMAYYEQILNFINRQYP